MGTCSRERLIASIWDIEDCFEICFPGKIKGTDVDFFVEKNGHRLIIELKGEGGWVPLGQHIALKSLLECPTDLLIYAWGVPSSMSISRFHAITVAFDTGIVHGALDDIRDLAKRWYAGADKYSKGTRLAYHARRFCMAHGYPGQPIRRR